ncbi:MAG: transposase, partial [Chitinispirillaceae bacterium]|nr:transposase [Chitinispirillaceae bacterium]
TGRVVICDRFGAKRITCVITVGWRAALLRPERMLPVFRRHKVEIDGNVKKEHIHLVLSIPPSYCVSRVIGFLKGKSAIQVFRKNARLRKK